MGDRISKAQKAYPAILKRLNNLQKAKKDFEMVIKLEPNHKYAPESLLQVTAEIKKLTALQEKCEQDLVIRGPLVKELNDTIDETCTQCTSHKKTCTNSECPLYLGIEHLNEKIMEYYE